MVVLRHSDCHRIDLLENLAMGRRIAGWVCFLGACGDRVNQESKWWSSS